MIDALILRPVWIATAVFLWLAIGALACLAWRLL